MKKTATLTFSFALAALSACAPDIETTTHDLRADYGQPGQVVSQCPVSTESWLSLEWPIESILAGTMELSQAELVAYLEKNPGSRGDLVAEMAAVQLNMALGLEVPDSVAEALLDADDWVMDGSVEEEPPPPVLVDVRDRLRSFNDPLTNYRECSGIDSDVGMAESPYRIDAREGLFETAPTPERTKPSGREASGSTDTRLAPL